MNGLKNIECFWDTLERCTKGELGQKSDKSKETAKVYRENFTAQSRPHGLNGKVIVEENTTFGAAEKYLVPGKTAVLDFANPIVAGGGVKNGANAQEESLCRQSSLYPCISNSRLSGDFYDYHRGLGTVLYSDRLIYARDITVIKDDDLQLLNDEKQFDVDVIVCAAPYSGSVERVSDARLEEIFHSRIKNILEAAIDGGAEVLILGAFGCGAFGNPPEVVARAFRKVIEENNYTACFDKLVFAIKSSVSRGACPNLAAFESEFADFAAEDDAAGLETAEPVPIEPQAEAEVPAAADEPESVKPQVKFEPPVVVHEPEFLLPQEEVVPLAATEEPKAAEPQTETEVPAAAEEPEPIEPQAEIEIPAAAEEPEPIEPQAAAEIKPETAVREPRSCDFAGKKFSVFGDSISTLAGFIPSGYSDFYEGEVASLSGVKAPADTWWGQVIDYFGGSLLVNNSWSGCKVTKLVENSGLFPSACSNERTDGLHKEESKPDVIMIYLGFNDWAFGASLVPKKGENGFCGFEFAYENMLRKIKGNYPDAMIWCCTLCGTKMSGNPNFSFPFVCAGKHINMFNNIIRGKAEKLGCTVLDIAAENTPYDSIDGTHPNADGMRTLSSLVIKSIEKIYGKKSETKPEDIYSSSERKTVEIETAESEDREHGFGFNRICAALPKRKTFGTLALGAKVLQTPWRAAFDAEDEQGKPCALSIYNKKFYNTPSAPYPENPSHPTLQKYKTIENADEYFAVVYEKIAGTSVKHMIKTKGAASEDYAVWLGIMAADALTFLHGRKPSSGLGIIPADNIVVMPSGAVRLVFEGRFDPVMGRNLNPNAAVNAYVPPEAYGGAQGLSERSDVYSLGAVLYALVTGIENPTRGMVPVRRVNPRLSPELEQIISGCTAAKPENRIQTCKELLRQLNALAGLNARRRGQVSRRA